MASGVRLTPFQWLFFLVTMIGIVTVGRSAGRFEGKGGYARRELHITMLFALGSAVAFAVGLSAGQHAAPTFGSLQTVWISRLVAVVGIMPLLFLRRPRQRIPARWWPPLAAQGLLDAGGYLALFQGSMGPGAEIAAITASGYAVVTVLLARFILREAVGILQWGGIGLVFVGAAALSG
jgi:drug/metabolite transporter (DMT)-like permease